MRWLLRAFKPLEKNTVASERKTLAGSQSGLPLHAVTHRARNTHDDQDNAQVNNKAPVTPLVFSCQGCQGAKNSLSGDSVPSAHCQRRVEQDSQNHKGQEGKAEEGEKVAHIPTKEEQGKEERCNRGPEKVSSQVVPGSFSPGNHGAHPHKEHQQEKKRNSNRVEVGGADAHLNPGHCLGDEGENSSQKNREERGD